MTQRLHPEDLRALIAAILYATELGDTVACADTLLAELAKTAKPEPATTIEEVAEGRTVTVYPCPRCGETDPTSVDWWRGVVQEMEQQASELRNKLTAAVAQLETAEARVKELEALASVEVQQRRQQRIAELEARNAQLLALNAGLEDTNNALAQTGTELEIRVQELEAALQTARAEGAKEERERLKPYVTHAEDCALAPYAPWKDSLCVCGLREAMKESKP